MCVFVLCMYLMCVWVSDVCVLMIVCVSEFLLEVMSGGCSDVLLWSVFSCLLLLTVDPLFFSQCHAVYGTRVCVCMIHMNSLLTLKSVALHQSDCKCVCVFEVWSRWFAL